MKHSIRLGLTTLLCLCSLTTLLGQKSHYPKSLWVGVHGGLLFSRYQFIPRVSQTLAGGHSVGFRARVDLEKGASAQIELNYSETGWQEKYDDPSLSFRRRIRYYELPLMTHLYLEGERSRFYLNIGPYIGYYAGDRSEASGSSFTTAQLERQTMPIKHKLAWGLVGGPGFSLRLGERHRLELEGRIQYNLQDIWAHDRSDPYGQSGELRLGIHLGYLYRL